MNIIGDVKGRKCLMVDDMIDTAGTLVKGAEALIKHGAVSVDAAATHGLFSYDSVSGVSAYEKIEKSALGKVIVMDTIPQKEQNFTNKIVHLSVASIFAKAISAIHNNDSVSDLFV
jgi:ribose-phosphate pyrophosphokinase